MENKQDKKYLYESMPIGRAIVSLAIPTILSQIITVVYNMADTFFIGQLNDPAQVAAASLCMPPFVLLTAFSNLFGIGGASLISRSLGAGKRQKAKQTAAFSIITAAVISFVYGLLFLIFKPVLLPLLGTGPTTYDFCFDYMFWTITVGAVPTVMNAALAHIVRSEGYSKQAGIGVAFGGLLNIALDPIFIFVFKLDIKGAAMATALSNFCAMAYFIVIIARNKNTVVNANPKNYTIKGGILKEVVIVGLPTFIMHLTGILSNTILNRTFMSYSDEAMAGMSIAKKLDMLTLAATMGMAQGVISLVGYNYASKNHKRMLDAIKTTFLYTMIVSIFITLFLFFCAVPVSRFFIDDDLTVFYAQSFLKIICLICPFQAVTQCSTMVFQALGLKIRPLIISIMRKGIIDIPMIILLNKLWGVMAVPWSVPFAEFMGCAVALILFIPVYKRVKKLPMETAPAEDAAPNENAAV